MKTKGRAMLWWMGNKWHLLLTAKGLMGASCHMVWKLCVSCQFVTGGMAAGMFVKAQSVWLGDTGRVSPEVHLKFIYTAVWGEKTHAMGKKTPWKTSSSSLPLPSAERFRALTVTQKFSKRLGVSLLLMQKAVEVANRCWTQALSFRLYYSLRFKILMKWKSRFSRLVLHWQKNLPLQLFVPPLT